MKDTIYVSAALINGKISNDKEAVAKTLELSIEHDFPLSIKLIRTDVVNFMVACDMGYNWEQLQRSGPIFQFTRDQWREAQEMGIVENS